MYEITLISICVCFSAYFSATEAAITSLSELRARHALNELGEKAKSLELWIKHSGKVLHTVTIGNNFVNILASVLAADVVEKIFNNGSIAITTGFMTFFVLFFGELVPKAVIKNHTIGFSIHTLKVLKLFYLLLYPLTWIMDKITIMIANICGTKKDVQPKITEDELEFLINVSEKEGVLEKKKGEMLTNIFDISDIYVREVMVPRIDIVAVPESISKEKLWALIKETEFSRIPVYRESLDDIIGILYVKDLLKMDGTNYEMKDVMKHLREPLFVPETKKIDAMLKDFQKGRLHMAVVMDEYGGTAGIVTMEDILEEIVGDIFDEYDEEDNEVTRISENHYIVDAGMNIDDFCEEFSLEKTEDMTDYETLGGFILDFAGEIPNEGYSFEWKNHSFTVKKMKDRRLVRIEVKKLSSNTQKETVNE